MAISSPGVGSGLDVRSIVTQLVALERRPIELLQAQKTKLNTQLSSFGLLQSYVGNLQAAAGHTRQCRLLGQDQGRQQRRHRRGRRGPGQPRLPATASR